jgi:2-C-methyl-D-erythritol 2,4-cyclodiphosphate synthase
LVKIRIGQGLDVHAFTPGDHIMLGGVRIPHDHGVAGHSDGDVALHALCDALLGAVSLGDIGRHFPPGDDTWLDADSLDLLARVYAMLQERGWRVSNVDLTVACEAPRVAPHAEDMRRAISRVLAIGVDDVSVKATTTEQLGFCGRREGIAAMAVALIEQA